MKKLELHLIGYSLLSVVIPIKTFPCGFVRLKVQEVILDKHTLVTLGHTNFLPNHHTNYSLLFRLGTSYTVVGFLAKKKKKKKKKKYIYIYIV